MKSVKRIPIKAAKDIAEKYNQEQVVIITFDKKEPRTHVVTYGKSLFDCQQIADWGNWLKEEVLMWPKSLCQDIPARVKRKQNG